MKIQNNQAIINLASAEWVEVTNDQFVDMKPSVDTLLEVMSYFI